MPRTPATPQPEPEPQPVVVPTEPVPTTEPTIVYVPAPSYLDRVRENRMGALLAALLVGLLVGLLLSLLVPGDANVFALILLGALVLAAVGFTVRYLSDSRGFVAAQVPAFLGTVFGVHIMAVTGAVSGANFPNLGGLLHIDGPGFDEALLVALTTPAVSSGAIFAGLAAAIIAGWGPREVK